MKNFLQKFADAFANPDASATLATGSESADNALLFTASEAGNPGNAKTITITAGVGNNRPFAVTVTGNDIAVTLATGSTGTVTTTAALFEAAFVASGVTVALDCDTGAGIVQPMAKTALAGGYSGLNLADGVPVYPGFGPLNRAEEYISLIPGADLPPAWPTGALASLPMQFAFFGPPDDYGIAYGRARDAYETLVELGGALGIEGYEVTVRGMLQGPYFLGIENGRSKVVFNALLFVKRLN